MPRIASMNGGPSTGVIFKVSELISIDEESFVKALFEHTEGGEFPRDQFFEAMRQYKENMPYSMDDESNINKIRSWLDCLDFFKEIITTNKQYWPDNLSICFEYKTFNGNYVDAIIVMKSKLLLLEFKSGKNSDSNILDKYKLQLEGYYDEICHENKNIWQEIDQGTLTVKKYLIYTAESMINKIGNHDWILSIDNAGNVLTTEIAEIADDDRVDHLLEFIDFTDPSLSAIFSNFLETGIINYMNVDTPSVDACKKIIDEILPCNNTLGIILVKGAPGTGKTGTAFSLFSEYLKKNISVQCVTGNGNLHTYFKNKINDANTQQTLDLLNIGFSEGQKPSPKELSDLIMGRVHILYDDKNYIKNHKNKLFNKQLILVDEAQRMWNSMKIALNKDNKNNKDVFSLDEQATIVKENISEAFLLLDAAVESINNYNKSICMVFFLGSGQEIYVGEENGEQGVLDAIARVYSQVRNTDIHLKIYVPDQNIKDQLSKENVNSELNPNLMLVKGRRNLECDTKLTIVNDLISGALNGSHINSGYTIYNDFSRIESILDEIPAGKNFGILIPSCNTQKANKNQTYKSYYRNNVINEDLYEADYINNLNNKNSFNTEFDCQGLEYDYTILIWGDALLWRKGKWKINSNPSYSLKNYCNRANEIIKSIKSDVSYYLNELDLNLINDTFVKNAYRVLLTRARIQTLIYVDDRETYEHLIKLLL